MVKLKHAYLRGFSEIDILVYCQLLDKNMQFVSPDVMCMYIWGEYSKNHVSAVKQSLEKLPQVTKIEKNLYEFVTCEVESDYVLINMEDLKCAARAGKECLIKYYCYLVGSFYKNTKVGNLPVKYFAERLNLSERTIVRYSSDLEDLKLIYIKRNKTKRGDDGGYYQSHNEYCLYKDKNLLTSV